MDKMPFLRCQYNVIDEKCYHFDLGEYNTYGIEMIASTGSMILHDVSTCKKSVERLVFLSNRHQLSPIHIYDVILDMIM